MPPSPTPLVVTEVEYLDRIGDRFAGEKAKSPADHAVLRFLVGTIEF